MEEIVNERACVHVYTCVCAYDCVTYTLLQEQPL